ncbi:MAG: hypothetical protein VX527_04210 [Planctomycetota bacterium]|nr:hypothetical protein [Planctomycetota bacterium]
MGAWMRSAIRTPHAALVLATLSQLLPAPASAFAAGTAAMRERVHEVYADSGTIQAAIEKAVDGDTILVGPGLYRERINLCGKAITIRSEAGAEQTLIDGTPVSGKDPGGSTVTMCSGEGPDTQLMGFSIAGGDGTVPAQEGSDSSRGGGFYLSNTSPIVRACLVLNNTADRGGAVYTEGGTPVFLDCWFYLNTSRAGGATIDCVRSRPRILACGFHEDGIQWENTGSISVRSDCGDGVACCVRDACIMATRTACEDAGGRWQAENMPCVEGTCPQPCPEDVNGDARVNMTDMLGVMDAWGACP